MRNVSGFSLLELVVTLLIAGILAATAIPYFADTQSRTAGYHEQVKAAVRFAQRQAVAQRRNVYVCVQATSVSLGYDAACSGAGLQTKAAILQIPQQLGAPSGSSVSATSTPFSFNALGQPNPNTDITLNVAGRSIIVTMETGYVRVP